MPVSAGQKFGPYEILSPLGAGGMGEVYKARDTRLDRFVAVKVLPEHIAKREDLRQRFEREARAVASLNHPHICVLHDIGNQDGTGYMVMEHLEGETLAARIARGALPFDQALQLATQIADALDCAHRAGVTHRDVKPANLMLTRDGVKVLDFGLAKSGSKPPPTEQTLTAALTTEGSVLGTPQYMAPEQFEGKEADTRSDIWAFGAVLYEMVTGEKAFQGKSYTSLVDAILSADPRPMLVKPFTPPALERLVRRCLAKDPEDRWQSMRDVVLDLRMAPQETATPARTSRWPWAVAAVCLVVAALAVGWGAWMRRSSEPALPVKLDVSPPDGSQFGSIFNRGGSAISPDGRTLAFVATTANGETLLYVRPLESLEARALPGTQGAGRPFWSPDSKLLAFVAGGKLKRIEVAGGSPITLCDAGSPRGGTWNEDGVIVFGDRAEGLQRIPASGGTPLPVTRVNKEAGETFHYYPQFLPGGKQFLYLVRHGEAEKMGIYIGSLDDKPGAPATRIVQTQLRAAYDAGSGRLLYVQGAGVLMAQRLELDPPRLTGDSSTVAEGVRITLNNGSAEFSVSRNGTLFYGQGSGGERVRFGWRDRAGRLLETIGQPVEAGFGGYLSPDGSRIAYHTGPLGQSDIWVLELAGGLSRRVTFSQAVGPRWSPDGKHLYYNNPGGIYRKAADGSGEEELLMKGSRYDYVQSVSPDGKFLLYGNGDIMTLPLTGEGKPEAYLQTKYSELDASFSPDVRWVAYDSDASGRFEIYVQGFPERRGKWLVSAEGGSTPAWRADGKELYWVGPDGTLMAASVELQAAGVRVLRTEALFRLPASVERARYQPSRDGRRFLVYELEGAPQYRPMVVVQNWAARLEK
jgi:eukaryotic-like serine/threonine-protein kinase